MRIYVLSVLAAFLASSPSTEVGQIPADRAAASYQIYSKLVPFGETAGPQWPQELLLISDATITAIPDNAPCNPANGPGDVIMNPHFALQAPSDQQHILAEVLEDWDMHCHERVKLEPGAWKLSAPYRLLSKTEQDEFESTRFGRNGPVQNPKYKGASAVFSFSMVYFNRDRTAALVYATHWCGNVCGQGMWFGFILKNGAWQSQRWGTAFWIS